MSSLPDDLRSFDETTLIDWLKERNINSEICQVLKEHGIDGQCFLDLEEDDLKDLFPKRGHVIKLRNIIKDEVKRNSNIKAEDFTTTTTTPYTTATTATTETAVSLASSKVSSLYRSSPPITPRSQCPPLKPPIKSRTPLSSPVQLRKIDTYETVATTESTSTTPKSLTHKNSNLQNLHSTGSDNIPTPPPRYSNKKKFMNFLRTLGLSEKYPQKLQLMDALLIRQEMLGNITYTKNPHMLPYLILQKIMMFDYRRLPMLCSSAPSEFVYTSNENVDEETEIHPLDSFLALLHCCDDFLRQDMLSRLSTCQLAIPILLPNPCTKHLTLMLWAMRSIVRGWKCAGGKSKEQRIVDYPGPIISFIKIGNVQHKNCSKSKILNEVIGGSQNYFFHWDCLGGDTSRKFVNGLVELCCYFPSGKKTDFFTDALIFLNLRGEACDHPTQIKFFREMCFMSFVLLLDKNLSSGVTDVLKTLASTPGGAVIIFPENKETVKLKNSQDMLKYMDENGMSHIDIKGKNMAYIKSKIQQVIKQKLEQVNMKQFKTIANGTAAARQLGIQIDEDNKECIKGKALAADVMEKLNKVVNPTNAKAKMLPLQGQTLWHKWATLDKKSYQTPFEKKTVEHHNKSIEQQKKDIREQQFKYATTDLSSVMGSFINGLQNSGDVVRTYFLQWLKICLDNRSRDILPGMHTEYEQIRKELMEKRKEGLPESSKDIVGLVNKLRKQNKDLIEGSLGLEHLFRELGQIYEAISDHPQYKIKAMKFPQLAVELLNRGYQIELMDGDASHIPITWVSAVLNQLKEYHRDSYKKVFVISVLGIQSTGKSTLLNTMFGLQFNVSAGRCTRGAFLQLLPIKNNPKCHYVLIVDTEGLRAPELSSNSKESNKHDNELATFVIGLADVTIINILGESPGDLNDILQTATHAFIRMRKVEMTLSCQFVHQNVTVSQDDKLKMGQEGFMKNLNEMTNIAATAEHCENKYQSFQDVIKFNESKDITNFPGLWKGDPPMAPVNPGYSEMAQTLKCSLIELTGAKHCNSGFAIFKSKVERLWVAVCRENYIFSFKNTLEVTAYNELDAQFSEWSWTLHRKMTKWKLETANTIKNSSSTQSSIDKVAVACLKQADVMLNQTYLELFDEMKKFFEQSDRPDTLAQWRSRYENRLDHLKIDSKREAEHHCDLLKHNQHNHLKLENIENNHRQQLLKHISSLVSKSKHSGKALTQAELEKTFGEKWDCWMKQFYGSDKLTQMYATDDEIEYQIGGVLQQQLEKDTNILLPQLTSSLRNRGEIYGLKLCIDAKRHLSIFTETNHPHSSTNTGIIHKVTGFFGYGGGNKKEEDHIIKQASKETEEILQNKAKDIFRNVQRHFQNFDTSSVFTLLKEFIGFVEKCNHENNYMFTREYVVDMAITFGGYMAKEFTRLMKEIRAKNDPISALNKCKRAYFDAFMDQYKDISGDEAAAKGLCRVFSVAVETALVEALPDDIANHIRHSEESASFSQKGYFKVRILQDLAKENNFNLFTTYLSDIKSSFEWWTEKYVNDYCMKNNRAKLIEIAKPTVHSIFQEIYSTISSLSKGINLKSWLKQLHEHLSQTIVFSVSEMQDIIEANPKHAITNSEFFIEELTKGLELEEKKLLEIVADPQSKFSSMTTWNKSPHHILCDSLIGCSKQCPFCKEQCEITDSNHKSMGKKHYLSVHRPDCLGKYTWDENNKLSYEICSESIESSATFHNKDTDGKEIPFKEYQTIYEDWLISNESLVQPKYWQWFVHNYIDEIIEWAGASPSSKDCYPAEWKDIDLDEATENLSKLYKLN